MLAITFTAPPQGSQVSISILNTRASTVAPTSSRRGARVRARRQARHRAGRAWPASLVRVADDIAAQTFQLLAFVRLARHPGVQREAGGPR